MRTAEKTSQPGQKDPAAPLFLPQHLPAKQIAGDVFPSGPPSSGHTTDDASDVKWIWESRGADSKSQDSWKVSGKHKSFSHSKVDFEKLLLSIS